MRDSTKRIFKLGHLLFALALVVGLLATQGLRVPSGAQAQTVAMPTPTPGTSSAPGYVATTPAGAIETFTDTTSGKDQCTTTTLSANDDGSSPGIAMPFPLNFAGATYNTVYVNNNGNVTFNGPQSTYTPYGLVNAGTPIIAPFFADVDTRGQGSSPVTYGYGFTDVNGHTALCVDWVNVGYYNSHADKLNSFQLLLVSRPDLGAGAFDIVFNYNQIQWEIGDASCALTACPSGGVGNATFNGLCAHAGFSNGSSTSPTSFEMAGSGTCGAFLDGGGSNSLVAGSANSNVTGRYIYTISTGACVDCGPSTSLTFPAASTLNNAAAWAGGCATPGMCGTASSGSGVSSVAIAIRSTSGSNSGKYWNGSSFVTSAAPWYLAATGTTSWSYPFALPMDHSLDGTYMLQIQATDTAGNVSTSSSPFTIDTIRPISNIAFPVPGSYYNGTGWNNGCTTAGFTGVVGICGTAADNTPFGVATVLVSIQSESGPTAGEYWNGSSFAPSPADSATCPTTPSTCQIVWLATTGSYDSAGATYSYSRPFSLPSPDGTYAIASLAVDHAGNIEQLTSGATVSCSVCNGSLGNGSLGNGSLGNGSLGNGSLGNGSLGNGSLGNGSLGNGATNNGSLGNGSLGNGSLGSQGCLSNGSLGNGSLGNGSLGNGSLGNGSLGDGVTAATACDTLVVGISTVPPTATTSVGSATSTLSVNVDPTSNVHVTFTHPINQTTLSNLTLAPSTGAAPTCMDQPCYNVEFGPGGASGSKLAGATQYSVSFNGVADLAGNVMSGVAPFVFTTADTAPLTGDAAADTDGDGIPAAWDGGSLTVNGGTTINTGPWGFLSTEKDACIVENYMTGTAADGNSYNQEISQQANQKIVNAFAAKGIHLIIFEAGPGGSSDPGNSAGLPDGVTALPNGTVPPAYHGPYYGGPITMQDPLGTTSAGGYYDFTAFDQIRNTQFVPTGLAQLCRYAVIAHTLGGTTSTGVARGYHGSDFIIALGSAGTPPDSSCVSTDTTVYPACVGVGTTMQQGAGAMHELGHILGLPHGGGDDINYKPNYPSVMNYAWSSKGVPENGQYVLDYSSGTLPAVNEASLSDTAGLPQSGSTIFGTAHICPTSGDGTRVVRVLNAASNVNWSCTFTSTGADIIVPGTISYDINGDGTEGALTDHNDWGSLNFVGGTIGFNNSATPLPSTSALDSPAGPNGVLAPNNTPPPSLLTITASATTADGKPYTSLTWTNQNVTVHFTCTDAAGITPTCPADQTVSTEGSGQFVSGTAKDPAGQSESATFAGIQIDKTAPTISITTPTTNIYILNQPVGAGKYSCTDTLSGVAGCTDSRGGTSASPGTVDTSSIGPKSFIVSSADNVGNKFAKTVTYPVQYKAAGTTCNGDAGHAILQPVNADGSSVFKQGSTVPAKFRVCDYNGVSIGTAGVATSFKLIKTATLSSTATVNEAVDSSTPDTAFRWDSTGQQWIFNISTKSLNAGTTYYYEITLNDGTKIDFNFALK